MTEEKQVPNTFRPFPLKAGFFPKIVTLCRRSVTQIGPCLVRPAGTGQAQGSREDWLRGMCRAGGRGGAAWGSGTSTRSSAWSFPVPEAKARRQCWLGRARVVEGPPSRAELVLDEPPWNQGLKQGEQEKKSPSPPAMLCLNHWYRLRRQEERCTHTQAHARTHREHHKGKNLWMRLAGMKNNQHQYSLVFKKV